MPTKSLEDLKDDGGKVWDIIRTFERQDQYIREDQLSKAKRGEFYFEGYQHLFYDAEIASSKDITQVRRDQISDDDLYYTKTVNIFRAHGESVIAVLSNERPTVQYFPDDAQNSLDISTARNYSLVGQLLERHNKADLLQMRTLFLLWIDGFVAGYNFVDKNKKYGTTKIKKLKKQEKEIDYYECPSCAGEIPQGFIGNASGSPALDPGFAESPTDGIGASLGYESGGQGSQFPEQPPEETIPTEEDKSDLEGATRCPICGSLVEPLLKQHKEVSEVFDKWIEDPKASVCMEVYGKDVVKVAPHARKQCDTPYLVKEVEVPVSLVRQRWPEIIGNQSYGFNSEDSIYERYTRDLPAYEDIYSGYVTLKEVWLRPWAFYNSSVENGKELEEEYPDGCRATFVNGKCVEIENECLDDHWTIPEIPTSKHIHAASLGNPLFDTQDMLNEMCNLTLATIEQGIPETFVAADAIDFNKYNQTRKAPGNIFPILNADPGNPIGNKFHSLKTATVSQEIGVFADKLDSYGQMLVGAMPAIWGGAIKGGSKTFSEYQASKDSALQRLGITWKFLTRWWADWMFKCVVMYASNMTDDQNLVLKQGDSYVNMLITKDAMSGKIGSVEPEASGAFPLSWLQKRDFVMELLQLQVPDVQKALFSPENSQMLQSLSGLPELRLPGADSRSKQYSEIQEMLRGLDVPIDPELDDNETEGEVVRSFLTSDVGQMIKTADQEAYLRILQHFKAHKEAAMAMQPTPPAGDANADNTQEQ